MYERVCNFYFVSLFVGDWDLKTKAKEKTFVEKWLVCFEFISFKLYNSYLPSHWERSHEGRYRV